MIHPRTNNEVEDKFSYNVSPGGVLNGDATWLFNKIVKLEILEHTTQATNE